MKTTITYTFDTPRKPRKKKVYTGEDDARYAMGKCFFYEGGIGKVINTQKNPSRERWDVWFRRISFNKAYSTVDRNSSPGLNDMFVYGASALRGATEFVREATEIDQRVLDMAHAISQEAGRKLDNLIQTALEEVKGKKQ